MDAVIYAMYYALIIKFYLHIKRLHITKRVPTVASGIITLDEELICYIILQLAQSELFYVISSRIGEILRVKIRL